MSNKPIDKKKVTVMAISIVLVLICVAVVVAFNWQIPLEFDESIIEKVENNVILIENGESSSYFSLAKVDANMNIIDDDFRILNTTDLHLGTDDGNDKTMESLIKAIEEEKPDLVTLTGDIITSAMNKSRAITFADTMEKLGVYWAPVLGNHEGDNIIGLKRTDYPKIWQDYHHCLMRADEKDISGNGNYVINILNSNGKVRYSLYFIDSGSELNSKEAKEVGVSKGDYAYILPDQIEWYKSTTDQINALNGGKVKSMAFFHIPLIEYQYAYDELFSDGVADYNNALANGDVAYYGAKNEKVWASTYNSGMFSAIKEKDCTTTVFVGHDHINDFNVMYQGVNLVYGQCGGYGTYTMQSKGLGENVNGYNIITINASSEYTVTQNFYER